MFCEQPQFQRLCGGVRKGRHAPVKAWLAGVTIELSQSCYPNSRGRSPEWNH